MSRVRQANVLTAEEAQGLQHLWLNFSRSPHRRRRAILAGKIKRAVIESGGDNGQLASHLGRIWHPGGNSTSHMLLEDFFSTESLLQHRDWGHFGRAREFADLHSSPCRTAPGNPTWDKGGGENRPNTDPAAGMDARHVQGRRRMGGRQCTSPLKVGTVDTNSIGGTLGDSCMTLGKPRGAESSPPTEGDHPRD